MVCVKVDKLLVPKKEIITKSLDDKIEEMQKVLINGRFKRPMSTVMNFANPYKLRLSDKFECS
tara:strand:+ start:936 stop:1124 length:189 start_codon:yes stop_codon:yes gene_type:complete